MTVSSPYTTLWDTAIALQRPLGSSLVSKWPRECLDSCLKNSFFIKCKFQRVIGILILVLAGLIWAAPAGASCCGRRSSADAENWRGTNNKFLKSSQVLYSWSIKLKKVSKIWILCEMVRTNYFLFIHVDLIVLVVSHEASEEQYPCLTV